MEIRLECPYAYYGDRMRIMCKKAGGLCAHQYFKQCKGWFALTKAAGECQMRKERQ